MLETPPFDFGEKVALVTGASGSIGDITSRLLECGGACVLRWDSKVAEKAKVKANTGEKTLDSRVDLSSHEEASRAADEALECFGRLDIVAHCAGTMSTADIEDCSVGEWERTISANLTGTFNLFKAVIPAMKSQGGGRLVAVSSAAARSARTATGPAYVASKAGMEAMVRQLAFRLAPYSISVNAVAPGAVETEMSRKSFSSRELEQMVNGIPMRRMANPEEVAQAIIYLVSGAAAYVTGETLDLNGGSLIM